MKYILIMMLLLIQINCSSKDKIENLVEKEQYLDAYESLNRIDPDNQNVDMLTRKVEICLEYFIISTNHQMFGLKNLKNGEVVEELRGKNNQSKLISLDVENIVNGLLKKYPDNGKLYNILGIYYYEVSKNYSVFQGKKKMDTAELISNSKSNLEKASELKSLNWKSYFTLGNYERENNNYNKAIEYFNKFINLKDNYPKSLGFNN